MSRSRRVANVRYSSNRNLSSVKNFFQTINKNIKNINAKILIIRNFKLTINLINTLTDSDKLNLDYNSIIEIIKNLLYKEGLKNKEKLDDYDIRFHILKTHQLTFDKYTKNQLEIINSISEQLLDNLDYINLENVGLYSYVKPYLKTNDNYQDLYNILSESTITDLNNKNKNLFEPSFESSKEEYIKKAEESYNHTMCYDYIKKIYHLSTSFFGNLKAYHTNNITTYSYDRVPKIEHIIKYLSENEDENKWLKEIDEENMINNNYFNSINHHVFITPYLSIDNVKEPTIKHTIQSLEVKNLWLNKNDQEQFKYNDVDVKEFLTEWNNASKESETPMIINPNDFNLI
jgi:hypothetical protein